MKNIIIVGLGYVGLNLALIVEKSLKNNNIKYNLFGYDINTKRVANLKNNLDTYSGVSKKDLENSNINFIDDINKAPRNENTLTFIVCVPTPVYSDNYPNFSPLVSASKTISKIIATNDLVIYESTVYPGATEEICIPALEKYSNLKSGKDFFVGFSPERINPGDSLHQMGIGVKLSFI